MIRRRESWYQELHNSGRNPHSKWWICCCWGTKEEPHRQPMLTRHPPEVTRSSKSLVSRSPKPKAQMSRLWLGNCRWLIWLDLKEGRLRRTEGWGWWKEQKLTDPSWPWPTVLMRWAIKTRRGFSCHTEYFTMDLGFETHKAVERFFGRQLQNRNDRHRFPCFSTILRDDKHFEVCK